MHSRFTNYLLLLIYGLLMISPQFHSSISDIPDTYPSSRSVVCLESFEISLWMEPKLNQNWQQNIVDVFHSRGCFLTFLPRHRLCDSLKMYATHNTQLHYNFPQICYKFPRSEHSKEG